MLLYMEVLVALKEAMTQPFLHKPSVGLLVPHNYHLGPLSRWSFSETHFCGLLDADHQAPIHAELALDALVDNIYQQREKCNPVAFASPRESQ